MRFPGTAWARTWHDLQGIGSLGLTVLPDAGGRPTIVTALDAEPKAPISIVPA
jgi:hypothetical protein